MNQMNDLQKRLANLSPQQRELILEKLEQQQLLPITNESQAIPVISREQVIPLSFAQQRLWFLEQTRLTGNAYHIPLTIRLVGQLDEVALQQSLNQIIIRHETLRTTFSSVNDTPVQVIEPPFELELPKKDLSGLTPSQQKAQLQQLLEKENEQQFNLEVDPPIRAQLLKLGATEYLLQVTLHHIASDGWSMTVLTKELSAYYTAAVQKGPSPLPKLPIQYADFTVWQRNYLQGQTLQTQLDYWKQKLRELPQLQLPTDHPRPAVESFKGAGLPINLPASLTSKLTQLTQQQGVTLFMTLLAAFKVLLYRYSGQEQIAVGSPIANRNRKEIEGLIGFFVNSLVMYTDLSGEPSFLEILNRVKQTALEADAHQDLPFEKLVEELQPERSLSQNPLFQVVFAVQQSEAIQQNFTLPNLELVWDQWAQGSGAMWSNVRMDLEFHLWQRGDQIQGFCTYNRDLFEAETISRMLSHYQVLLSAIVENPEQPISRLPLMSEIEKQQLLVTWNNTKKDYPTDQCLHQLFESVVEKTPLAIAVSFEDQRLTYSQVNHKANQLAHYLLSLGITPEMPVGIYLDPTPERIIGVLAILKAGGAYVPLDPTEPSQDVESISIILTQYHLKPQLPDSSAQILCLDTEWESIAKENTYNPNTATTATNLAYILNQTVVEHQTLTQRLLWLQETLSITNQDILLHQTSLTHEVALLEIGLPLLSGGSIVIASTQDPTELQKLIAKHHITIVHLWPSQMPAWLDTPYPTEELGHWRSLLCSGELLSTELANSFTQRFNVSLENFYSLPEAAGEITHWHWQEKPTTENIPLGNAGQLSVYLLDQHQNPVPIGIPGEIYVGGSSLARGYLQQPQQTAQEFIEHPQLGRLFRTGDIARHHHKGYLEIVGAKQRYVWIQGKRVQLADIETALLSVTGVEQAYVLAHQTFLVAYVVVVGSWKPQQLHSHMQQQLPPYMMPQAYVPLSSLPLTLKGKVDEVVLARFPVIDDNLVQRWEAQLAALPEIEQVAVVVQPKTPHLPPLHLSDLLPSEPIGFPNNGATTDRRKVSSRYTSPEQLKIPKASHQ